MKYLLLSILVVSLVGFMVVPDAFGVEYARVNIQHAVTQGCEDDNSCYNPHTITIKQFDWVKWKNLDIIKHTITAGYPANPIPNAYDSGLMNSGSTFEHQFHQVGKYPYFCMIHPWAQGFIIVKEGSSTPPPPTPPAQTQTTTTQSQQQTQQQAQQSASTKYIATNNNDFLKIAENPDKYKGVCC